MSEDNMGVAATPPGHSAEPEPEVSALRASVPNAWRAWKGSAGDDVILCVGLLALLLYIYQSGGFPNPLPVAVFAPLAVLGRRTDRP